MRLRGNYSTLADFCLAFASEPERIFDIEDLNRKERLLLVSALAYNKDALHVVKDFVKTEEDALVLCINNPKLLKVVPNGLITQEIISSVIEKFPDHFFESTPEQFINRKSIQKYLEISQKCYVPDKYMHLVDEEMLSKIALHYNILNSYPNHSSLITKQVILNSVLHFCNLYYGVNLLDFRPIHPHPTARRVRDLKPLIRVSYDLSYDPTKDMVKALQPYKSKIDFYDLCGLAGEIRDEEQFIELCKYLYGQEDAKRLKFVTDLAKLDQKVDEDEESQINVNVSSLHYTPDPLKNNIEYLIFLSKLKKDYTVFKSVNEEFKTLDAYKILDFEHFEDLYFSEVYDEYFPKEIQNDLIVERSLGECVYKKYQYSLSVSQLVFHLHHIIVWGKELVDPEESEEYKEYKTIILK